MRRYAPIFPEGGNPFHPTPPIASMPCIACMGREDQWYEYGKKGLGSVYARLQWVEHAGGHEAAKEPAINDDVARRIWQAAGFAPPPAPSSSRTATWAPPTRSAAPTTC